MIDEGNEWYQKFLSGDERYFEKIVIRYRNGMIGFIQIIVEDFHSAEDIAEDVFITIYLKKPNFTPTAGFRTWLYSIAKNMAKNYVKRKNRLSFAEVPEYSYSSDSLDKILNDLYLDSRKIALHKAMDELPGDYRTVLYLYFFEELKVKEISFILKKKPKAISDALLNAKKALKTIILNGGNKYEILRGNIEFNT